MRQCEQHCFAFHIKFSRAWKSSNGKGEGEKIVHISRTANSGALATQRALSCGRKNRGGHKVACARRISH